MQLVGRRCLGAPRCSTWFRRSYSLATDETPKKHGEGRRHRTVSERGAHAPKRGAQRNCRESVAPAPICFSSVFHPWLNCTVPAKPELRSGIWGARPPRAQRTAPSRFAVAREIFGSVTISGARLCEPQHVALPITLLRVTDPRSESKLGHCQIFHAAKSSPRQNSARGRAEQPELRNRATRSSL